MRFMVLFLISAASGALSSAYAAEPTFHFPLIKQHGGVAAFPGAVEQPRADAKVVFDITADSQPADVHRGLESVARYLNLNAQAGHAVSGVKLALVLHGGATKVALRDEAFRRHTSAERNPNLPLLRELKAQGVEVFVCGQSLARNKFFTTDVADELTIAASAMTVNVNKQLAGYAYLAIH